MLTHFIKKINIYVALLHHYFCRKVQSEKLDNSKFGNFKFIYSSPSTLK
jgi:hypothetical protein